MVRPRVEAGQVATPERLLEAAELEFARHGFHGAKLQAIAERAGISRPSLLYHFSSKQVLYSAVVESVLTQIGARLQSAMALGEHFQVQVEAIVKGFVDFLSARPSAARVVLRELMDDEGPGQAILLQAGVPLLEMVEAFLRDNGGELVPQDLPLRGAVLQLMSSAFVKASCGQLESALWGDADPHLLLTRQLFQRTPS